MPAKGSDYALLQRKFAIENRLKEDFTHRPRALETPKYLLASQHNNLEGQRMNLRYGLEKLPPSLRQHYLENINNLTTKINTSKMTFPLFQGNYDM